MLRVIAMAILSIGVMGATTYQRQFQTVKHPACVKSPEQYASFVKAILDEDEFVVKFYMQTGCGLMKADLPATIIEKGPYWIKIKVEPEGSDPVILYTSSKGIVGKEE